MTKAGQVTMFMRDGCCTFFGRVSTLQGVGHLSQFDFPCEDGFAVTPTLAADTYHASSTILDGGGLPLSVVDFGQVVISDAPPTDLGVVLFRLLNIRIAWTLGNGLSCAEAQASQIRVIIDRPGNSQLDLVFDCSDQSGHSPAVTTGTYTGRAELLGTNQQVLSNVQFDDIVVANTYASVDLPFALP